MWILLTILSKTTQFSHLFRRLMIHLTICQTLSAASFMFTVFGSMIIVKTRTTIISINPTVQLMFCSKWMHPMVVVISSFITYIFTLTVCLLITQYLSSPCRSPWFIRAVVFLILCSRKHYTVDIVVALYTVPMVWALLQWKLKDPKVEMYYDS